MPVWLLIITQILNILGSSGAVGLATYAASNSAEGAIVAGAGAFVQHIRKTPLGVPA